MTIPPTCVLYFVQYYYVQPNVVHQRVCRRFLYLENRTRKTARLWNHQVKWERQESSGLHLGCAFFCSMEQGGARMWKLCAFSAMEYQGTNGWIASVTSARMIFWRQSNGRVAHPILPFGDERTAEGPADWRGEERFIVVYWDLHHPHSDKSSLLLRSYPE